MQTLLKRFCALTCAPMYAAGLLALLVLALPQVGLAAPTNDTHEKTNVAMGAWKALHDVEAENGIPHGLLHSISLVETGQGLEGQILPWPYTVNVNTTSSKKMGAYKALLDLRHMQGLGFKRFNVTMADGKKYSRISSTDAEDLLKRTPEDETVSLQGSVFAKRFNNKWSAVFFVNRMLAAGYDSVDIGLMQINWRYHSKAFTDVAEAFDPYKNARYAVSYLLEHRQDYDWWQSVGRYHSKTPKYATRYVKNVWAMYQKVHRLDQYGQQG